MSILPSWAPNLHPLVVHYPIALLSAAIAVDLVAWAVRCNVSLRNGATLLYVLGTGGAIAAYLTGRAASQTISLPGMGQAVIGEHWSWAFRTVWFFGSVTVARLVFLRPSGRSRSHALVAAFALAGLIGLFLLVETGDRGSQLVFEHSVGVLRR